AIVPIRDADALANLKPDLVRVDALLEGTGARFCYFICPERESWREVRARMFFYGGEDPATGSAAGCAVSWMVRHGLAKSDVQILIRQGVEAGRPSEIFVRGLRSRQDESADYFARHCCRIRFGASRTRIVANSDRERSNCRGGGNSKRLRDLRERTKSSGSGRFREE